MECSIELGDSGVRQTFFGPTTNISGWSFVQRTSGPCVFTVANRDDVVQALQLGEGVVNYGTQITERIRAGATGGEDKGGWRIRSLDVRPFGSQQYSVTLGDGGKVKPSTDHKQTGLTISQVGTSFENRQVVVCLEFLMGANSTGDSTISER
jgi:hypothetical protein